MIVLSCMIMRSIKGSSSLPMDATSGCRIIWMPHPVIVSQVVEVMQTV